MSARRIFLSPAESRGLLEGRVSLLLRPVTLREFGASDTPGYDYTFRDKRWLWNDYRAADIANVCPFGVPGDTLWGAEYVGQRREASRHVLTLASVRVLRVRDISEEDARATGFGTSTPPFWDAWTARYGRRYPWESAWAWALGVERGQK